VDLREEVVILDGGTVRLTPREYRLLALLVEHAGVVVTRPVLLMQFGGYSPEMRERRVDACLRGLRRKLGVYADQYLETVTGVGYVGYCFRGHTRASTARPRYPIAVFSGSMDDCLSERNASALCFIALTFHDYADGLLATSSPIGQDHGRKPSYGFE
jgi:hypothetical protein